MQQPPCTPIVETYALDRHQLVCLQLHANVQAPNAVYHLPGQIEAPDKAVICNAQVQELALTKLPFVGTVWSCQDCCYVSKRFARGQEILRVEPAVGTWISRLRALLRLAESATEQGAALVAFLDMPPPLELQPALQQLVQDGDMLSSHFGASSTHTLIVVDSAEARAQYMVLNEANTIEYNGNNAVVHQLQRALDAWSTRCTTSADDALTFLFGTAQVAAREQKCWIQIDWPHAACKKVLNPMHALGCRDVTYGRTNHGVSFTALPGNVSIMLLFLFDGSCAISGQPVPPSVKATGRIARMFKLLALQAEDESDIFDNGGCYLWFSVYKSKLLQDASNFVVSMAHMTQRHVDALNRRWEAAVQPTLQVPRLPSAHGFPRQISTGLM